ncbi:GntR family transcriptional regulator [Companilactobacillus halodurans]|uniref:GntR family transcriptional regulator n=1 Tax=Companilactobacillus halodurans TaxID=2584183 RepID=A0A5P0ZXC7_9LACO|nr:GntR family transcriptional regulator [Companilactobacillus halodurans]MQS75490.1 GntR family transcriptional regulator [Companilactobacillus halodurans]MQS97462.1 GntR family transcriptional regulator [Companilactobacillus halodurans]
MVVEILYQKVAADIKKNILSGAYPVDSLIPTENDLEQKYDVSKITVRKAVEQLVADGYLRKKSGIGTRVISDNLFNKLSKAKSYSAIVNEQGKLTKEILSSKILPTEQTPLKDEFTSPRVVFVKRLYSLDDEPFIIVNHLLPKIEGTSQVKNLNHQSLYKFLKDNGQEISHFSDEFSAIQLDDDEKKILNKKDALALKRIRRGFDNKGNLIEYTESIYDSNKMPYKIEYDI